MKAELQKKLFDKYPRLFQQKDLDMRQTCMCWGLECGPGWYNLLDRLCHTIEEHFWNKEVQKREDYHYDFKDFCQDVSLTEYPTASQVKEKFGGLRFYTTGCDDFMDGAIRMAESMSYKICETCGNPGKPNDGPWIRTECKECRDG